MCPLENEAEHSMSDAENCQLESIQFWLISEATMRTDDPQKSKQEIWPQRPIYFAAAIVMHFARGGEGVVGLWSLLG